MVAECTLVQTGSGHMALLYVWKITNKQADSGLHRCSMVAGSSLKFNRNLFNEKYLLLIIEQSDNNSAIFNFGDPRLFSGV